MKIRSGHGLLIARPTSGGVLIQTETVDWYCPGSAVEIMLRTDTLEKSEEIVRPEVFEWF